MAIAIVYEDELLGLKEEYSQGTITKTEYKQELTQIFNRTDEETIARCVVMQEFQKKDLIRINEMWYKIKLITWQTHVIWLVVLGEAIVIASIFIYKYRSKIFGKINSKGNIKTNKKDLIEISRKEIK